MKTSPKKLDKALSKCCAKLDKCSVMINELPLQPKRENILRVGRALAEVFELRSEIYKLHPHLKPKDWDDPASEKK